MIDKKEWISILIKRDIEERNLLLKHGYYSRVKHVLDQFDKEPRTFLIDTEIFKTIIVLHYINSKNLYSEKVYRVLI